MPGNNRPWHHHVSITLATPVTSITAQDETPLNLPSKGSKFDVKISGGGGGGGGGWSPSVHTCVWFLLPQTCTTVACNVWPAIIRPLFVDL